MCKKAICKQCVVVFEHKEEGLLGEFHKQIERRAGAGCSLLYISLEGDRFVACFKSVKALSLLIINIYSYCHLLL